MNRLLEIAGGILGLVAVLAILAWVGYRWLKASDDPSRLVFHWIISAVIIVGVLAFAAGARDPLTKVFAIGVASIGAIVLCAIWGPGLLGVLARPFTNLFDGGDQEVDPQPFYSIAESRRKQGKYLEAITEIRKQLARFPCDFAGMMMLADIQAEHLNDLAGAENTIDRLLAEPGHTPRNIALALNRLADWRLKIGQDPDSAREALERVIQMVPETEQAYVARQRIAHLTTPEMLAEKREPHRVKLGHYQQNVGLLEEPVSVRPPEEDAAVTASNLVKHLEQYPQDAEARERLALIYAEHYHRLDLASGEIEQLVAQPHAPAKQVVHWLNTLADLRIKHTGDVASARQELQRIVDLFPKSAAAESAKTRIAHLQLEMRAKQKGQVVKLGSYEQNIGLK